MIPAFSPAKSTFRLDSLSLDGSFANSGVTNAAFYWTPAGDRVYYSGEIDFDDQATIRYADASTAFDVSTLSFAGSAKYTRDTSNNTNPSFDHGINFLNDGTKLIAGHRESGSDVNIFQYTGLSPAYVDDGSVETIDYQYTDTGGVLGGSNAGPFVLSDSGAKINYIVGSEIYRSTLSTANDLSTIGTFTSVRDFSAQVGANNITAQCFGKSETRYYIAVDQTIYEYRLSTAGDVSTATYVTSHDLSGDTGASNRISCIGFANRGQKFFAYQDSKLFGWDCVA